MRGRLIILVATICLLFLISIISAQELLDIKIDKQIYSAGENVTFNVLLLSNNAQINEPVLVAISDFSDKKQFTLTVIANKEQSFRIEKDFASGYWRISASYKNKTVKRFFSVGEREEADFSIEGDKLIIRNTGNVPYSKTLQILIGDKIITQKQYIDIGEFKEIRLVAPDGKYNVQVTDGQKIISKSDIQLTGTARVIGALDEELVKNPPSLGGVRESSEDNFFSSKNFSPALVLLIAIFAIFILLLIERTMRRKRGHAPRKVMKHYR
jgi:hypothetical protein